MKRGNTSLAGMTVALILVTAVASVSLGFVYAWTKGPIEQVRLEKQLKAIEAVTGSYTNDPVTEQFVVTARKDPLTVYPAQVGSSETVYAIKTWSGQGYSGNIELMAGVDDQGAVTNVRVLSHMETPGLGSKITNQDFIDQYVGKTVGNFDFRVSKDGGEVDAISGATISTRAFSEALEKALAAHQKIQQP